MLYAKPTVLMAIVVSFHMCAYVDVMYADGFSCHLRLALLSIMNAGKDCIIWIGQKCSSFCGVNRGTSGRSCICGLGNTMFKSVQEANLMMSRSLDTLSSALLCTTGPTCCCTSICIHIHAMYACISCTHYIRSSYSPIHMNIQHVHLYEYVHVVCYHACIHIFATWLGGNDHILPASCPRTCLLIYMAEAMGLVWVLEQPKSSTAEYHHRFWEMRHKLAARASVVYELLKQCGCTKVGLLRALLGKGVEDVEY